jgi:hypothetical protein
MQIMAGNFKYAGKDFLKPFQKGSRFGNRNCILRLRLPSAMATLHLNPWDDWGIGKTLI